MNKKIEIMLWGIVFIGIFVIGWFGNSIHNEIKTQSITQSSQIEISNISQCSNLSLRNTSYCLRDYIKTFYNYTIRSDIPRTEEDIRQNGGDCYDYTELYVGYIKELGFNGYHITIKVTDDVNHGFAVISNEEGYCILD